MGREVSAGAYRGGRPTGDSDDDCETGSTGGTVSSKRHFDFYPPDQEEVVSALKHSLQTGQVQKAVLVVVCALRRATAEQVSCRTSCGGPQRWVEEGLRRLSPPRFYGPPGTGKTTVVGGPWVVFAKKFPPPPPPPLEVPEALALMKQFFGKDWRSRVKAPQTGDWVWVDPAAPSHEQELNASDERGISAVREKAERMEFCMAGCRMV